MTDRALDAAAVAAGGVVGTLLRAGVDQALPAPTGGWPWSTVLVNLLGSLLLGALVGRAVHGRRRLLLGTGVAGSLTTFSTLVLAAEQASGVGRPGLGVALLLGSTAAGLLCLVLGTALGRRARGRPA